MDQTIYAQFPLPLDEDSRKIRVLKLERGDWDDVIRCSLDVVNLNASSNPEFEAISYVWGGGSESPPHILVDGRMCNVHVNLLTAIRHFRSTTSTRTLWVDAICINQNDVKERNRQVGIMGIIYRQCKRVLIWLGESEAATSRMSRTSFCKWETDFSVLSPHPLIHDHDREKIRQFVARYKRYYELPFALRYHSRIDSVMGAYCLISLLAQNYCLNQENFPFLCQEASRNIFLALGDIVSRPWWTRIWVIQELVLAPQAMVYYGRFIAPWDLYVHAARNYDVHRRTCCEGHYQWLQPYDIRLLETFMHAVLEIQDLRQQWQALLRGDRGGDRSGENTRIYLRHLLWKFRSRISSDPRDQIYALLSLVNSWGAGRSMYVDYKVDMKILYQVTPERIINAEESLLILAGVTAKKEGHDDLPSWVPDWTTQPSSRFESERLERLDLFKASNGAKMKLPVRVVENSLLRLHGKCVDEVTDVSDLMTYDDRNLDDSFDTFASWYNLVIRGGPMTAKYVTGRETRMEAYWRTLCMDTARKDTVTGATYGKGYEYQRCAPDYVQKSLDSWMDPELKPHLALTRGYHQIATSSLDKTDGATQITPPLRTDQGKDLSIRDESLNYIEVDFAICSATMHGRILMSRHGLLGLGPSEIKEGDQIYIFAGGHVPFIVRKAQNRPVVRDEAESCFELVGDCYVHGIMDGESMAENMGQEEAIWLV